MFIPFGEYKPDSSPLDSTSTSLARNCIPGANGDYLPFPSPVAFATPHPDRVRGVIAVNAMDRTTMLYVGTQGVLWQLSGRGWIGRGFSYAMTGSERWSFCQWRNNIIAVSAENDPVISTINGSAFGPMITSIRRPRARHVAVVNRDWVVLGNTSDGVDGERPGRVWFLARGNPASADPNTVTQCDFEDMDSSDGQVVGLIGAEYGTIICNKAIWRMTYEGGDTVFRFDKVVRNKGSISGGSVIGFGRTVFFWDEDGPYIFDGTKAEPIGDGKMASTAVNKLNQLERAWISSAIVPRQTIVAWAIPTGSANCDIIYLYNWKTGKWSFTEVTTEMIFSTYSSAMLLDDSDFVNLLIDQPPQSNWPIDGEQFQGGLPALACFDTTHSLKFFNGPPMEAVIDTNEMSPFKERRASVTSVRPIVDGASSVYVSVLGRDTLGLQPSSSQEMSLNMIGSANTHMQGRYLKTRVRIPSGFEHAIGVEVDFNKEGVR